MTLITNCFWLEIIPYGEEVDILQFQSWTLRVALLLTHGFTEQQVIGTLLQVLKSKMSMESSSFS